MSLGVILRKHFFKKKKPKRTLFCTLKIVVFFFQPKRIRKKVLFKKKKKPINSSHLKRREYLFKDYLKSLLFFIKSDSCFRGCSLFFLFNFLFSVVVYFSVIEGVNFHIYFKEHFKNAFFFEK